MYLNSSSLPDKNLHIDTYGINIINFVYFEKELFSFLDELDKDKECRLVFYQVVKENNKEYILEFIAIEFPRDKDSFNKNEILNVILFNHKSDKDENFKLLKAMICIDKIMKVK